MVLLVHKTYGYVRSQEAQSACIGIIPYNANKGWISMILADIDILDRVRRDKIIDVFDDKKLQACSYDLTITENVLKFNDNNHSKIYLSDNNQVGKLFTEIKISRGYDLRPHEYVMVELNERIKMPADLCGCIKPRTTLIKLGLQITPQFINPTYEGRLRIGLYNSSPFVFELMPNLIVCQVIFEVLSNKPSEERLYERKDTAKYQCEDAVYVPSGIYEEIDSEFKSYYDSLLEIIRK